MPFLREPVLFVRRFSDRWVLLKMITLQNDKSFLQIWSVRGLAVVFFLFFSSLSILVKLYWLTQNSEFLKILTQNTKVFHFDRLQFFAFTLICIPRYFIKVNRYNMFIWENSSALKKRCIFPWLGQLISTKFIDLAHRISYFFKCMYVNNLAERLK